MDFKTLLFIILMLVLVVAIMQKLLFIAFTVIVIAVAYYTGLASVAIDFFIQIYNFLLGNITNGSFVQAMQWIFTFI